MLSVVEKAWEDGLELNAYNLTAVLYRIGKFSKCGRGTVKVFQRFRDSAVER